MSANDSAAKIARDIVAACAQAEGMRESSQIPSSWADGGLDVAPFVARIEALVRRGGE